MLYSLSKTLDIPGAICAILLLINASLICINFLVLITIKKKILGLLQQFFSRFNYDVEKIYEAVPVWPKSDISHIDDKFLLLFTPPNSGSTAIARFVCQSNKIHGLEDNCEVLYILKGLWGDCSVTCAPFQYINYKSLAGILSGKINKLRQIHPKMEYIFEKSPDNVFRYKKLLEMMPNTKIVANNRNPYAQIASSLKRYDRLDDKDEQCRTHIHYWLVWSEYIREACETDNIPLLTYEQFCAEPIKIISAFNLNENEFNKSFHIKVKDYKIQKISNMNENQIAFLSDSQKEIIDDALVGHEELLAYFRYEIMA